MRFPGNQVELAAPVYSIKPAFSDLQINLLFAGANCCSLRNPTITRPLAQGHAGSFGLACPAQVCFAGKFFYQREGEGNETGQSNRFSFG